MAAAASVLGEGERSHGRVVPPNTQRKKESYDNGRNKKGGGKDSNRYPGSTGEGESVLLGPFPLIPTQGAFL